MAGSPDDKTSKFFESVLDLDRRVREFAEAEPSLTSDDVELFRDLLHSELQSLVDRYHR